MFEERRKRMVAEFEAQIAAVEAEGARKRITPEMERLCRRVQQMAEAFAVEGIRVHEIVVDKLPMYSLEKPTAAPGEVLEVITVAGVVTVKLKQPDAASQGLSGV